MLWYCTLCKNNILLKSGESTLAHHQQYHSTGRNDDRSVINHPHAPVSAKRSRSPGAPPSGLPPAAKRPYFSIAALLNEVTDEAPRPATSLFDQLWKLCHNPSALPSGMTAEPPRPVTPLPTFSQLIQGLRIPGQWNGIHGDIVPMLLVRLPNWPLQRGLHIENHTPLSVLNIPVTAPGSHNVTDFIHLQQQGNHYFLWQNAQWHSMPKDGDCFYHAVLNGLHPRVRQRLLGVLEPLPFVTHNDIALLRQLLADYVQQHPAEVEGLFVRSRSSSPEKYSQEVVSSLFPPAADTSLTSQIPERLPGHVSPAHSKKWFSCRLCSKSFDNGKRLHVHINTEHHQATCVCDKCGTHFADQQYLQQHIDSTHHTPTYACQKCTYTAASSKMLNHHTTMKHCEKKSVCNMCEREFAAPQHLQRHINLVHSEKKYVCSICEKKFATEISLQLHVKRIHSQKKYLCDTCDECFTSNWNLKRHIDKDHNGVVYQCPHCDNIFTYAHNLQTHIRIMHNKM
ncbi:C2H2-type zinc finger protein [Enterobacteriaceae bacterium LUAb1]